VSEFSDALVSQTGILIVAVAAIIGFVGFWFFKGGIHFSRLLQRASIIIAVPNFLSTASLSVFFCPP